MDETVIISECKEPWLYWWELLSTSERKALKQKYFPASWPAFTASLLEDEIKSAWEREKPDAISDFEWLLLAEGWLEGSKIFDRDRVKEIWRQVYRIASQRI